jgi:hypothetical protein
MGYDHVSKGRRRVYLASTETYPETSLVFLHDRVFERLATRVLRQPYSLRYTILESNHGMFPVSDMVSQIFAQYNSAPIERIKVHVECIYSAISFVSNDDGTRSRSCSQAVCVWFDSLDPGWILGNI